MYKYLIQPIAHDREVYVDLIASPAGQYISRQPYVLGLVKEIVDSLRFDSPIVTVEKDMGRVIGNTDIVDTTEKDTIYYAKAYKKSVFSRFAKNRYPAPSSILTAVFKRDTDKNYELTDTWIGPDCPPFPGDDEATTGSKLYWEKHALIHNAQIIQSKTITKVCPY